MRGALGIIALLSLAVLLIPGCAGGGEPAVTDRPAGTRVLPMRSGIVRYKPIGVFHTDFTPETGAPRQGLLRPDTKATIEVYEPYRAALETLAEFEYIWVLYHFDEVETWNPTVNPPQSHHEFGLFGTRSPKRPCPIGLSLVKLEKIEDGTLFLSGVDTFEGTPVLDIKPYLPSVDSVKSKINEAVEIELGHHDEDFIKDPSLFR